MNRKFGRLLAWYAGVQFILTTIPLFLIVSLIMWRITHGPSH